MLGLLRVQAAYIKIKVPHWHAFRGLLVDFRQQVVEEIARLGVVSLKDQFENGQ